MEISRKMPFASEDAHSSDVMRSEASSDAESSSSDGKLSEKAQMRKGGNNRKEYYSISTMPVRFFKQMIVGKKFRPVQ